LTIRKFMTIDLIVLSVMALVVDIIGYYASKSALVFFYVSLSIPIMMIAYVRWGIKGISINILAILVYTLMYQNFDLVPMLLYAVSVLSVAISMIWFRIVKKNHIKDEFLLLTMYYLTGYLALFIIQAVSQLIISNEIQWITLTARHSINFLLGWVILFIASKQQDFMVDMKAYLLKSIQDRKKEGKFSDDESL
jgi:hypothetical protein